MVNTAVSEMEGMTQRNAALVEESSAAGVSLAEQASQLQELMGFFRKAQSTELWTTVPSAVTAAPAARPSAGKAPVRPARPAADDWSSF